MAKHRLAGIYCNPKLVKKESLERHKNKAWSAKDDRGNLMFWENQKRKYLKENPSHCEFFAKLDKAAVGNKGEEDGVTSPI